MKNKLAAWIVLGLIAVIAAVCLAATNEITKDIIAEQGVVAAEEARRALVPEADAFEAAELAEGAAVDSLYTGLKGGKPVGYVAQITVQGFGGPVEITAGTDTAGTLTGIRVGGQSFAETAGLGAKAKDAKFTDQFEGKTAPLAIGDTIDAITAATITSSAVVRGVNTAIDEIGKVAGFEIASTAEGGSLGDGRYFAVKQGFAGPVYVELTIDADGKVAAIIIGNEEFAETAGFGQKALEPAFYEQFIGKEAPFTLGDNIDAITGATITSKAVVEAANLAMLYHTNPEAAANAGKKEAFVLPEVPADAKTETASAQGFAGPVEVTITVDAQGEQLLRIEIGGDKWAETEGFGSRAKEPEFWQQFIGKAMPVSSDEIDVVTGATLTSNAVIKAVNDAYYALFPEKQAQGDAPAVEVAAPAPVEKPEGTVTASAQGFAGPVAVEIAVDENGAISYIHIGDDKFAETAGFGAKAQEAAFYEQFIGKTAPVAIENIDAITGATITTKAVLEAVNAAFEQLAPAAEAPEETPVATEEAPAADASAYMVNASKLGYAGPVYIELSLDDAGAISYLKIGNERFSETPGLGAKVLDEAFAAQFIGKVPPLAITDIDAITGATITTQTVIDAINAAFEKLAAPTETNEALPGDDCGTDATGTTARASKLGAHGPVFVEITVDENGAISAVKIGNERFSETDGLGAKALEETFTGQFVGMVPPIAIEDIDALTGATITTQAVIDAINEAYEKLAPAAETADAPTADAPAQDTGRTANASKLGYAGPVYVEVTVDAAGAITAIKIGNDRFAETPGLGAKALDDAFTAQFIGKVPPLAITDIDAITGATITTEAVINAINTAFDKLPAKQ